MTVSSPYHIGVYNVDTALRLLGPEDFGPVEPKDCLEVLILMVKNIAMSLLRMIHYLFGDHQWYNNQKARQIVEQFIDQCYAGQPPDALVVAKVQQLFRSLSLRANGNVSYAHGLDLSVSFSHAQVDLEGRGTGNRAIAYVSENTSCVQSIPLMREVLDADAVNSSMVQDGLLTSVEEQNCVVQKKHFLDRAVEKMLDRANYIQTANGITADTQSLILCEMTKIQALSNPELALDTAKRIMFPLYKVEALCGIVHAQAVQNAQQSNQNRQQFIEKTIQQAMEIALAINRVQSRSNRSQALCTIFEEQLFINPAQALTASSFNEKLDKRIMALCKVAKIYIEMDSEKANMLLEKAFEAANRIAAPYSRAKTFCKIGKIQALTNAGTAVEYFRQAREEICQVQDLGVRSKMFYLVGKALSSINPDQAVDCLQQGIAAANQRHLATHSVQNSFILSKIAKVLAPLNGSLSDALFQQVLDFGCAIENATDKVRVLTNLVQCQAPINIETAFAASNLIENSRDRSKAICMIVKSLVFINPEQALETAQSIQDDSCRNEALQAIVKHCAQSNLELAFTATGLLEYGKAAAYCEIAKAQASINPEKAYDCFQKAFEGISLDNTELNLLLCQTLRAFASP